MNPNQKVILSIYFSSFVFRGLGSRLAKNPAKSCCCVSAIWKSINVMQCLEIHSWKWYTCGWTVKRFKHKRCVETMHYITRSAVKWLKTCTGESVHDHLNVSDIRLNFTVYVCVCVCMCVGVHGCISYSQGSRESQVLSAVWSSHMEMWRWCAAAGGSVLLFLLFCCEMSHMRPLAFLLSGKHKASQSQLIQAHICLSWVQIDKV